MSILQEYEDIRRQLGEEEWNNIDTFLSENKQYQLSDVLYKERVWKIYEDWKRGSSDMKINRKKNIKASGNDIVDNLLYLTQNMWFEPIDKFSDVIYNGAEIMNSVDLSDCVEFGTNNGQEILIYDTTSDGRKHIKYSCSTTTMFDELVITDVWDDSGCVYECDWDAIWDELAAINNWNGDFDYDEVESSVNMVRRGSNMRINRKRNIKSNRKVGRRPVKAAESYGWVVDDWRAQEAYDFAIDSGWWNEADLNADIVKAISQEELAACLAFIFRNNDFQAWNEYSEGSDEEDIEESRNLRGRKSVTASYGGWGNFYGLEDVEFTVPNDTDDPTIFYNGNYYNYYDIEDTLWSYYKEECEENGTIPDEYEFETWVADNSYLVYDTLDIATPKTRPGRGVTRR